MRNQFFDPGFLFDFYSDRGSMATPSGCSNVSWCGLKISGQRRQGAILEFFQSLIAHGTQTRRAIALIFGTLGEC